MAGRALLFVGLLCLLAAPAAWAQQSHGEFTAEIRIALKDSVDRVVSVTPGTDSIVLDLPGGAEFPEDFEASSGRMLRQGSVEYGEGRIRLELELVRGRLERVVYEPKTLVLHLRSGVLPQLGSVDPREQYLLGPDDKIVVTVHGHPDLAQELDISRSGWITASLVGQVKAAGLSPGQLGARLAELLGASYLVDPQVDVAVKEYRSQWVMVGGEVLKPGRIPLRGGTRLKEILSVAEGLSKEAGEEITITRRIPGTDENRTLHVSRDEFESGRSNPSLLNGDIVEVQRAAYCYIQGEVREAGRVRIEPGMTLMRAITMARGLTDWADRKNVRVLYGDNGVARERTFNLNKIEKAVAEDPVMRGGEIIIVKKRFL